MLNIFKLHKHTTIVIGAWGCGSYGNPAHHIASIFKEVLNQPQFKALYADTRALEEFHISDPIN